MYSDDDTPKGWVAPFGHPRIKACSRLPMAFRSVPRPSSPPGAKASTECPSHTRYMSISSRQQTHHAQKPSSDCRTGWPSRSHVATPKDRSGRNQSSHITGSHPARRPPVARATDKPPTRQDRSHVSELSPPTAGALIPKDSSPGQTCSRTTGWPSAHTDQHPSHAPRDAPEPDSP